MGFKDDLYYSGALSWDDCISMIISIQSSGEVKKGNQALGFILRRREGTLMTMCSPMPMYSPRVSLNAERYF